MSSAVRPVPSGARIRELRDALGLSQKQLAAELGVTDSMISRVESGTRRPSRVLLARITAYFAVDADEIATSVGVMPHDLQELLSRDYSVVQSVRRIFAKEVAS